MADIEENDPIVGAADEAASRHQLTGLIGNSAPLPIWSHLDAMKDWLTRARQEAAQADRHGSAAAEWLLDNDYQIQRAILQIREDLPAEFYAKLPGLAEAGLRRPRIHQLAHAFLQASHLQVSLNIAVQFIDRYQKKLPLSIAETWAFPTMLRIVSLELLVTGFSRLFPQIAPPFQVDDTPGTSIAAIDDTECVARGIANLAVTATIQWNDFFDRTSRVETILKRDPAGIYARMDFETRDRYRHAVEQLAKQSGLPEWDVAQRALRQCHTTSETPSGHVGYWLVDAGRRLFADALDPRPWTFGSTMRRAASSWRSVCSRPAPRWACSLCPSDLVSRLVWRASPILAALHRAHAATCLDHQHNLRELARDPNHTASSPSQTGFQKGHPQGLRDRGRDARSPRPGVRRPPAAPAPRSAPPLQSRREPRIRASQRLGRRRYRDASHRHRDRSRADRRHRGPERALCGSQRPRSLSFAPSPTALQCGAGLLDGLGA
ncbi:hypothetical protein [Sphingobium sp. GW456-12-10-14-TSB1]|uniref:hypothetical protein n=1 Tax=Sphingobium sp. GW456-12-10-14-TSB1 TaxID=1987165 RepID=UPI0020CC1C45|nr:hypothetical protein [Sphingobium sp. GW456-12-10-14-TSB1]